MQAEPIQFSKLFTFQFRVNLVGIRCVNSPLAVDQNRVLPPRAPLKVEINAAIYGIYFRRSLLVYLPIGFSPRLYPLDILKDAILPWI